MNNLQHNLYISDLSGSNNPSFPFVTNRIQDIYFGQNEYPHQMFQVWQTQPEPQSEEQISSRIIWEKPWSVTTYARIKSSGKRLDDVICRFEKQSLSKAILDAAYNSSSYIFKGWTTEYDSTTEYITRIPTGTEHNARVDIPYPIYIGNVTFIAEFEYADANVNVIYHFNDIT